MGIAKDEDEEVLGSQQSTHHHQRKFVPFCCVCVLQYTAYKVNRSLWSITTQHTSFVIRYAGFNYSSTKSSVNQTLLLVALCCLLSVLFCLLVSAHMNMGDDI